MRGRKGGKIGNSICYSTSSPSLPSLRNGTKQAAVVFLFFFKTTEWWRRQRFSRNGSSCEKKKDFFKKRRLVVCTAILDAAMKKEKEEEAMLSLTQVLFRPPPPFLPNRKQTFFFSFSSPNFLWEKRLLSTATVRQSSVLASPPLFLLYSAMSARQTWETGGWGAVPWYKIMFAPFSPKYCGDFNEVKQLSKMSWINLALNLLLFSWNSPNLLLILWNPAQHRLLWLDKVGREKRGRPLLHPN